MIQATPDTSHYTAIAYTITAVILLGYTLSLFRRARRPDQ
jgi:hypothetical protein